MLRSAHKLPLNTTGLEADVMRFMAIIAFCLIAIMALVKKIEPVADDNLIDSYVKPTLEVGISPEAEALTNPPSLPVPVISRPDTAEKPREPDSNIMPRLEDEPEAVQSTRAQSQTAGGDNRQNVTPDTLTLRFDSDRTFLHLIATDSLQLYARTADGFLGMDSKFNVMQSAPAGALYEVMPESIPRKISRMFEKNTNANTYLVALPAATKRDLNKFLNSGDPHSTGALVIHRDGHISHES